MVDNALGKSSRIANSVISRKLQTNIETITGMECGDHERIALHYSEILGSILNIPSEEINYYHCILALKNISGGEDTLNALNSFITDASKSISKRDIILNNLGMIYGEEFSTKFSPEDLKVLDFIINNNQKSPVSFSINSGYNLAYIQEYLQKAKNKSLIESITYVRSELNNIVTQYNNQQPISFSYDIDQLKKELKNEYLFNDNDLGELKEIAEKLNCGQIKKSDVVNLLDNFSPKLEKDYIKGV